MPGYIDNITYYRISDNIIVYQIILSYIRSYYRISDHINKYHSVPRNNEEQLERAVARQPVSVAIQANQQSFQLYKKGIYSDPDCGDDLDHGVLVVGYGYDNDYDMEYWIVKNSWGTQWGDNGYLRMAKGIEDPEGQCGIAMDASYPVSRKLIST